MAAFIESPTEIKAEGVVPKTIREFIGVVNSGTSELSVARMRSPQGWSEPGQTPSFDEYTVVLQGKLKVETRSETYTVNAGQAFIAARGEWVRYSTPDAGGAEYVAVCLPAFTPETVHRD